MKNNLTRIWYQTVSGVAVDLSIPLPEQIVLDDIAYSLAGQNRFNGHSKPYWSVAAHSVLATRLLETATPGAPPNLLLACLLHDAHEAYIGDLGSPVKQALEHIDPASMDAWRTLETSVQQVIHTVFDLPRELPADWLAAIKRVNTAEGFFGLFKMALVGIHHAVSAKHLHRYVTEHTFRYNRRGHDVGDRIARCLIGQHGRLRLRELFA